MVASAVLASPALAGNGGFAPVPPESPNAQGIHTSYVFISIFAFAISFDNFTLSLFLTSARLTPLPIELFAYLKYSFDPTAAAVSAFAIGVALVLVLGIARFMGLEEFTGF